MRPSCRSCSQTSGNDLFSLVTLGRETDEDGVLGVLLELSASLTGTGPRGSAPCATDVQQAGARRRAPPGLQPGRTRAAACGHRVSRPTRLGAASCCGSTAAGARARPSYSPAPYARATGESRAPDAACGAHRHQHAVSRADPKLPCQSEVHAESRADGWYFDWCTCCRCPFGPAHLDRSPLTSTTAPGSPSAMPAS